MRPTRMAAFIGIASLAVAGTALADPGAARVDVMTVDLPGGSNVYIHFAGDAAPPLKVMPVKDGRADMPAWGLGRREAHPFALFERIAAEMDRRMAELMRRMPIADPHLGGLVPDLRFVASGNLPPGTVSYVSRTVRDGACIRTVEMTRTGAHAVPRVVTRTSGDCGDAGHRRTPGIDARRTI